MGEKDQTYREAEDEKVEAKKRRDECRQSVRFWIEIVGAPTLVLAVIAAFYQACEMQRTLQATNDNFRVTERAWVYPDEFNVGGPLVFKDDGGAEISLVYVLRNVGHSPAMHVWTDVEAFLINDKHKDQCEEQRRFCAASKASLSQQGGERGIGSSLFPGQSSPFKISFDVPADQIKAEADRELKLAPSAHPMMSPPQIVGCVEYTSPVTGEIVHQTPFSFVLDRTKPERPEAGFAFDMSTKTVPPQNLALRDFQMCGGNAD